MQDELYDYICSDIEADRVGREEETGRPFTIDTQEQAVWAIRKLSIIRARKAEAKRTVEAEMSRINEWYSNVADKADREDTFFSNLLGAYMSKLREEDPKLKTLALPGGKLTSRKQQPEYIYDEGQLLPWVKENLPGAVVVKETVSKTAVKEYVKETGEVVPGVSIEERPDKFNVEVD